MTVVTCRAFVGTSLLNRKSKCGYQTLRVYFLFHNFKEIGVGLTAFGLFFMFLGIVLFFDGGLLAIGNILFLSGLLFIIGVVRTLNFFSRKEKIRGTFAFLGGIMIVFLKYPFIGMTIEAFGFINLFGDFFPVVIGFLRKLPIIGNILSMPGISQIVDKIAGSQLPV